MAATRAVLELPLLLAASSRWSVYRSRLQFQQGTFHFQVVSHRQNGGKVVGASFKLDPSVLAT